MISQQDIIVEFITEHILFSEISIGKNHVAYRTVLFAQIVFELQSRTHHKIEVAAQFQVCRQHRHRSMFFGGVQSLVKYHIGILNVFTERLQLSDILLSPHPHVAIPVQVDTGVLEGQEIRYGVTTITHGGEIVALAPGVTCPVIDTQQA